MAYPVGYHCRLPFLKNRTGVIFEELKGDGAGGIIAQVKYQIRMDDDDTDTVADWSQIVLLDPVPAPEKGAVGK